MFKQVVDPGNNIGLLNKGQNVEEVYVPVTPSTRVIFVTTLLRENDVDI
jgi:hypothetical protein